MTEYKTIIEIWNKRSGGNSRKLSMFEDWSDDKLNKYDTILIHMKRLPLRWMGVQKS